jgi:hypothetical protein
MGMDVRGCSLLGAGAGLFAGLGAGTGDEAFSDLREVTEKSSAYDRLGQHAPVFCREKKKIPDDLRRAWRELVRDVNPCSGQHSHLGGFGLDVPGDVLVLAAGVHQHLGPQHLDLALDGAQLPLELIVARDRIPASVLKLLLVKPRLLAAFLGRVPVASRS